MDPTTLYSTRIKKTFDEDQADILQAFREKFLSKEPVKLTLINYYQGLPIIYPATVVGVERGTLDLDISPQQAVAIASDHYTLIRCKLFNNDIAAHVQYVNIKRHAATLVKLCFVEITAEKRAAVRIDIAPPIRSTIIFNEQEIAAGVTNISAQGLALSVDDYALMDTGTDVFIKFLLPDPVLQKQTLLKLPAILVDIEGFASPYTYKFRITPDKHQEQLISRYIFQRQVDIIHELKSIVD